MKRYGKISALKTINTNESKMSGFTYILTAYSTHYENFHAFFVTISKIDNLWTRLV